MVGDVHCEISQVRFTPQEVTDALLFMKPYNQNLTCEKSQSSLDVLISLIVDIRAYIYIYMRIFLSALRCTIFSGSVITLNSNSHVLIIRIFVSLICTLNTKYRM